MSPLRWLRPAFVVALAACGRLGFEPVSHEAPPIAAAPIPAPTIAVGEFHTCALTAAGTAYCWGGNYTGEIGTGDYVQQSSPFRVGEPGRWSRIATGAYHTCALDAEGATWCWGDNGSASQLGVGDYDPRLVPARVPVPGVASELATSSYGTHVLTGSGARWAWGDNRGSGDLGIGSGEGPQGFPMPALGDRWVRIEGGYTHACGLRDDASLWCWGDNGSGQLGTGDLVERWMPTQLEPASTFLDVGVGEEHTCAVRGDGVLLCWGDRQAGALGDGMTTGRVTTPQEVAGALTWRAVDGGANATCAIASDGGLWCWGANNEGQLGVGDLAGRAIPTEVMPGSRWLAVDVSATGIHTCGLQLDETVWCWGENGSGQLGEATVARRTTPTRVMLPP